MMRLEYLEQVRSKKLISFYSVSEVAQLRASLYCATVGRCADDCVIEDVGLALFCTPYHTVFVTNLKLYPTLS